MLRGAAAAGAVATLGLGPAATAMAGPAGMPTYRYLRDALAMPLNHNPTGEFIFPCIRGMYDKISNARARYHLYTEVGNAFHQEVHLGVFHSPIASDNGRVAAPSFGTQDGVDYMFYEAGQRLHARICIARAV